MGTSGPAALRRRGRKADTPAWEIEAKKGNFGKAVGLQDIR